MHDVHYNKFNIRQEDTLENPQHEGKKFEAIVANPPFSAKWSANPLYLNDERFSEYGKLAPKSKADFAFVQHMIHHLDYNGTMVTVLPHGVLFRGGSEGHIRKYLIEDKNYLDAVIGMPSNIFFGTNIPTALLVFKKHRDHPNDIMFIDASQQFEKIKTQNVLRKEHIDKVIESYKSRQFEDKYAYIATMDDIKENDYNLNISRYVDTFEDEESIDLGVVSKELKKIEFEIREIDKKIEGFCEELGIDAPK
jgi:type I restriction enzyme M protein